MSLSVICPNCRLPEVVREAWTSLCLNCLHRQDHGDPTPVVEVDPGVDRPVRPGHSLTSNAGAEAPVEPEAAPVAVEVVEVPPAPPSEPEPADGA